VRLGNILFIHIPRTGGTHFEKLLGFKGHDSPPRCGNADYPTNHKEIMGWDKHLGIMLQHATYPEMVKHGLYKPEEELVTVSIIRDPYQRAVSLFKYYGGDKKWKSFNNFLKILSSSLHTRYFYYPQCEYLIQEEEVVIKNLIRFENYQEDMERFSNENNLDLQVTFDSGMQKEKAEKNLKKYYANSEHAKIVERVYARDFELLGYPHL
jgi:hypothetical protein